METMMAGLEIVIAQPLAQPHFQRTTKSQATGWAKPSQLNAQ